jgi:hypothetical protein
MALDPCVRIILCGLSNAVLQSLRALITPQLAVIQTQITTLTAQALKYDILAKATQALANVVIGKIQEIKAGASLIPLALIAGCTPLGDLNLGIQQSIDQLTASFEAFVQDATRMLSFVDELNLAIASLTEIQNLFQEILQTISTCGQ